MAARRFEESRMDCATYAVLITYDEQSEAYLALVPEVPGCLSQGETRQEALRNVKHDLEACLEAIRDAGEEVPRPHRYEMDQVTVPLPVSA